MLRRADRTYGNKNRDFLQSFREEGAWSRYKGQVNRENDIDVGLDDSTLYSVH